MGSRTPQPKSPKQQKNRLKIEGMELYMVMMGMKLPSFPTTWRIIPLSKWLVTPIYKAFRPLIRETTLGDLLTMFLNHLQVLG